MNPKKAQVRQKLKEALTSLEEARRIVAADMDDNVFTSKDAHMIAEAQFATGVAREHLNEK